MSDDKLKTLDPPQGTAQEAATRKWRNNEIRKRLKEEKQLAKAEAQVEARKPTIGGIVPQDENERRLAKQRKEKRLREIFSFLYEDMERKKLLVVARKKKALSEEERHHALLREKYVLMRERQRRRQAGTWSEQ